MGILIPTALLAILVATLTIAAGSGLLSSNNGLGIRTMATQSSEEAWQAAHKAAGKLLVPVAIVVLLGCLLVFSGATAKLGQPGVLGGILFGFQAVAVFASAFIAQRAANRVIDEGILHHHA